MTLICLKHGLIFTAFQKQQQQTHKQTKRLCYVTSDVTDTLCVRGVVTSVRLSSALRRQIQTQKGRKDSSWWAARGTRELFGYDRSHTSISIVFFVFNRFQNWDYSVQPEGSTMRPRLVMRSRHRPLHGDVEWTVITALCLHLIQRCWMVALSIRWCLLGGLL